MFTLLTVLLTSFAVSKSASNAAARSFFAPALDGQRIAFCLQSNQKCGKPVADAWCQSQGFDKALLFERDLTTALDVLYLDKGRPCSDEMCLSFSQIKCS